MTSMYPFGTTSTGGTATGGAGGNLPTLPESCATLCTTVARLNCDPIFGSCLEHCTSYVDSYPDATAAELFGPMVRCLAGATASGWTCPADPTMDGIMFGPIVNAGVCQDEVCAWTCQDGSFSPEPRADVTVYDRCGC